MRIAAAIVTIATLALMTTTAQSVAQEARSSAGMHAAFDELLDLNVRDGLVYYRALREGRGKLDRYVASLDVPSDTYEEWSRDQKVAFWLNAYNAFVLQTVVNNYPIRGKSPDFPANSIRQIAGAFERIQHRAAGRAVTLDAIEKTILPEFKDPRVYLALGRGAIGSGRLRSEAYTADRLESQLTAQTAEFMTRTRNVHIDAVADRIMVSPIFSWREAEFVAAYGSGEGNGAGRFAQRSPIERAILALLETVAFPTERTFLARNTFSVQFQPFDWRLNDLTGGRID